MTLVLNTNWSFQGQAFYRVNPEDQVADWPQSLNVSIDSVIGASPNAPIRYVDIGAVNYEPWSFRAGFLTEAARSAFQALRYTIGTLVTGTGATHTALCTKAVKIVYDQGPFYYLDVTFEVTT